MRGATPRRGDFRSPSAGRTGWFLAGSAIHGLATMDGA
jgi:hypothetical protein